MQKMQQPNRMRMSETKDIIIYQTDEGNTQLEVNLQEETVWLNLNQLAELFGRDKSVISRHLRNIFKTGELSKEATVANFATVQTEGERQVERNIEYYNLDAIISVGYRVNSKTGTQFRIWATEKLRQHLIRGYTLNQKRLEEKAEKYDELQQTLKIMKQAFRSKEQLEATEAEGLLHVISDFSYSLDMLDRYDHEQLELPDTGSPDRWKISYEQARAAIEALRTKTQASELFGREKDQSLKSSIASIYQSFDGEDLYPTAEQKAAHLLYFVVKNHSFSDGNKRIAAYLFLLFLEKNGLLYTEEGNKTIVDPTLVAITLMIAESQPGDKDMMIKVVVHLLQHGGPDD